MYPIEVQEVKQTLLKTVINPMLAKTSPPFYSDEYLYEVKWDGERIIAFAENGKIKKLQNRKGIDVSRKFPEIVGAPISGENAILDGEMIVLGENGKPSFSRVLRRSILEDPLKIRFRSRMYPAIFMAFDLLYLNGKPLVEKGLTKRKSLLSKIIDGSSQIIPCSYTEENGIDYFESAVGLGLEGIVGKRKNSLYQFGKRGDDWLKVKSWKSTQCHITGFTFDDEKRHGLGDLIIGDLLNGNWIPRGRIKNGIGEKNLADLLVLFKPIRKEGKVIWIEPVKIEIKYFEVEETGSFRCPIFRKIVV